MNKSKPFLRWAGGKTWLIKHLSEMFSLQSFQTYHEPFLGGGSIFFAIQPHKAFLSDLNKDLIETYIQVRENVEEVIEQLSKFENTAEMYYRVRNEYYEDGAQKAAKFIYLNQTSFNGIYRVNRNGEYNVPFGYRSKNFFDPDGLRKASDALSNVILNHFDFQETLKFIEPGDLVFLDPPYTVTHNNNGFIKYNRKLFDLESQYILSNFIDEIKSKGAYYILTNAAHKTIEEIFTKDNDNMFSLERNSLIGGTHAKRGTYSELVITNIK